MNKLGILAIAVFAFGAWCVNYQISASEHERIATAKIAAESRPICCSTPGAQPVYQNR